MGPRDGAFKPANEAHLVVITLLSRLSRPNARSLPSEAAQADTTSVISVSAWRPYTHLRSHQNRTRAFYLVTRRQLVTRYAEFLRTAKKNTGKTTATTIGEEKAVETRRGRNKYCQRGGDRDRDRDRCIDRDKLYRFSPGTRLAH